MASNSPLHQSDKPTLTQEGKYLLESWDSYNKELTQDRNQETLEISQVFGFIALVYEKLRATVENKDEHLLRRFAIERALQRLLAIKKTPQEKALRLVRELTWSRFIPNNSITRAKLGTVSHIISKYDLLLSHVITSKDKPQEIAKTKDWILGIASTEIEEVLAPSFIRIHLVPTMFVWLKTKFAWRNHMLSDQELETQLFIAAHRALAKSDVPILRYHLLLLIHPEWRQATQHQVIESATHFKKTINQIEDLLNVPYKNHIFRQVKKNTAPFIFIESILRNADNASSIIHAPNKVAQATFQVARVKYGKVRSNIRKGTVRSILYILVTKVVIAFLIEYPYERYVLDEINRLSLGINLLMPPFLMFLMSLTVSIPDDSNTQRILAKINNILYKPDDNQPPIEVRLSISKSQSKLSRVFTLVYIYFFIITSVGIAYILIDILEFNIISTGLFFMFVSLVLLFGFRLRWHAQELLVEKPRQGIFDHLISILSIPFINLGVMLSSTLSKINIITFILDKLIDRPLKSGVNSAEEWTQFLQTRQQEAVEVPGD